MGRKHIPTMETSTKGLFNNLRADLVAMAGEFVGTVLFLLFSLGAVQTISVNLALNQSSDALETGTKPVGSDAARLMAYYYMSSAFGLSLFAVAAVFYRFTGSVFNPNVGLALCLNGVITPLRFLLTATAQMLGGIVAAALVAGLTPGELSVNVALGGGTSPVQGLFIEMFATAALVLSVLMLAAEKHPMTPFAPLGFGFMLFVVMLFSIQFTGGAINTARAFGPACISGFSSYHWIYWLGPSMGAVLSTVFYKFLKYEKYWEVNPGQDSTDPSESA